MKRILNILACALCCASLATANDYNFTPKETEQFNNAIAMMNAGNYNDAVDLLFEMHNANPENTAILDLLGKAFYKSGDYASATTVFEYMEYLPTSGVTAYMNGAQALNAAGKTDAAIAKLRQATTLYPDLGQLYEGKGLLYTQKGQTDSAVIEWNKGVLADPYYADWFIYTEDSIPMLVPPAPNPPALVNDFSGVLGDKTELETKLENFAVNHNNAQICVVVINEFGVFDARTMATAIGNKWGVGAADTNNGVVVLIRPRMGARNGEAFIATSLGAQKVLTDELCAQIVNQQMIPHFKNDDYLAGVKAGTNAIMQILANSY